MNDCKCLKKKKKKVKCLNLGLSLEIQKFVFVFVFFYCYCYLFLLLLLCDIGLYCQAAFLSVGDRGVESERLGILTDIPSCRMLQGLSLLKIRVMHRESAMDFQTCASLST